MNKAAPTFFRIVQDALWEEILLSLARLTDSPKSCGKSNLTFNALPEMLNDDSFRLEITDLVQKANIASDFARDWRNRHIAHRDAKLSLGEALEPLSPASRIKVAEAISSLHQVLNTISEKYLNSTMASDVIMPSHGARALLYIIRDGINARDQRYIRLKSGQLLEEDLRSSDPI